MDYPKLRYGLEVLPFQESGQQRILLRDRLGYSDKTLVMSPTLLPVLGSLDGSNTLRDLQALYTRQTGELLFTEQLERLLNALDEGLFLENERFANLVADRVRRFRQDPVRRMQHAGGSYSQEPETLRRELMSFFEPENGGPGPLHPQRDGRKVLGMVAPHIDLRAGGPCFAHAYKAALESQPPATWIVLGTGHEPVENYFALTLKDFETPFGLVRCDSSLGRRVLETSSRDLLASEYNHHREHTVEFQAVFLSLLQPQARILPVLCAFSYQDQAEDRAFIDEFCLSLRQAMDDSDYPVGVLASVDLAHIGPRYGGRTAPNDATVSHHLAADQRLFETLCRCDADAFLEVIRQEQNERNVCGVAPLYVLARVLAGSAGGTLLQHSHAVVDSYRSFVTFASLVFYAGANPAA